MLEERSAQRWHQSIIILVRFVSATPFSHENNNTTPDLSVDEEGVPMKRLITSSLISFLMVISCS